MSTNDTIHKGDTMYLTYETALDALEKAVADRGEEYVYPRQGTDTNSSCLYWHKNEQAPGCLVGLALHQLGVSAEVLESFGPAGIRMLAPSLPHLSGVEMSPAALELMSKVQCYQDQGMPWGSALDRAVVEVEATCALQETIRDMCPSRPVENMVEKDAVAVESWQLPWGSALELAAIANCALKDMVGNEAKSWQFTSA
jgi:hypothetical protein